MTSMQFTSNIGLVRTSSYLFSSQLLEHLTEYLAYGEESQEINLH